jgi:hypothetical protein
MPKEENTLLSGSEMTTAEWPFRLISIGFYESFMNIKYTGIELY